MSRNLRGRLDKLEAGGPEPSIRWSALFSGNLDAFIASLPEPPVPPVPSDPIEERIAAVEALSNGTGNHP